MPSLTEFMAALTEERCLADQKLGMIAAVRRMAIEAVLRDRRMLEHERPSLFRVAFVAELIDRIGLEQFVAEGAMGIMTTPALDQPLLNGMMGLSVAL